ncbi:MAG: GntR family transcriptional regulator, partial [Litoreibacter sp.]|nr:GntR family transcriptional regulator [Litoreibacter sp.]
TIQLADDLRGESVLIEPGAPFYEGAGRVYRHYRLAYSSISAAQIAPGIAKIAQAIQAQR